jgi:hypothetical protein
MAFAAALKPRLGPPPSPPSPSVSPSKTIFHVFGDGDEQRHDRVALPGVIDQHQGDAWFAVETAGEIDLAGDRCR